MKENKTLTEVIELFKKVHAAEITLGSIRDYCDIPANFFQLFAAEHGFHAPKHRGNFKVDNPEYKKLDFLKSELLQMKMEGFDPNTVYGRREFALKHNIDMSIPHTWNVVEGVIVDFTADAQFVKTGMSKDTDISRYVFDEKLLEEEAQKHKKMKI